MSNTLTEIKNGLLIDLENDNLTVEEIAENNNQRVKAYHKAKVKSITDEEIEKL